MTQVPGPQRPSAVPVSPEGAGAPERQPQGQPAPATPPHGLPDDLHNALSLVIYKAGIPLSAAGAAAEAIAARPALLDALVAYRQQQCTVGDLEALRVLPEGAILRTHCDNMAVLTSDEVSKDGHFDGRGAYFANYEGVRVFWSTHLPATVLWLPPDTEGER